MQRIVFEEPYVFIPPLHSNVWPAILQWYLPRYLRTEFGIVSVECRDAALLRQSIEAGHGILLAPNHCRLSDPLVLGFLAREIKSNMFAMASWHLFKQNRFTTFMIRRMGAFSVYREGADRAAINAAVEILEKAERPLVIFPEGTISRHNDQLMALLDGTAFVARTAAKKRAKTGTGKVVVHPLAIRYYLQGDVAQAVKPILAKIETRLSWLPQDHVPLVQRICRIGEALLALKEVEHFGAARTGPTYPRIRELIEQLLAPLEAEWRTTTGLNGTTNVLERAKRLRTAILPEMVAGQLSDEERARRWRQLADCYVAQQLSHYPENYIHAGPNVPEHILETVERFEEDLTDVLQPFGPLRTVMQVGTAIEVAPERGPKTEGDPVMRDIELQLKTMLAALAAESPERVP